MTPVVKKETAVRIYHENVPLLFPPEICLSLDFGQNIFLSRAMQVGRLNKSHIAFKSKGKFQSPSHLHMFRPFIKSEMLMNIF